MYQKGGQGIGNDHTMSVVMARMVEGTSGVPWSTLQRWITAGIVHPTEQTGQGGFFTWTEEEASLATRMYELDQSITLDREALLQVADLFRTLAGDECVVVSDRALPIRCLISDLADPASFVGGCLTVLSAS